MKKSIILAASMLLWTGAHAEISPKLAKEINSSTVTEIYNAMDRFAADVDSDAFAEIMYDCWPDGRKMLTRRIQLPLAPQNPERARQKKGFKDFCTAYDRSNPGGSNVRNTIDSISSVRLYEFGIDPNAQSINRNAGKIVIAERKEAALASLRDNTIAIAQMLSYSTDKPDADAVSACADTLTNMFNTLQQLPVSKGTRLAHFTAETKNSGILRVRSYMKEEDVTEGQVQYLSCSDAETIWNKIYDTYMSFMNYDADISLTYMRKNRMLMLYSPSNHIINAACLKDNVIYLFTGTYSGNTPYLPSNWMHSVKINKVDKAAPANEKK